MEVSQTHRTDDWRKTVTIRETAIPWPLHFHFLQVSSDEDDQPTYVNVGFELGAEYRKEDPNATRLEIDAVPEAIDGVTLSDIAEKYVSYVEMARLALVMDREGTTDAAQRLRVRRKPSRIDDAFLRWVAADYVMFKQAGLPPGKKIAEKYSTFEPTASKWIKRARPFIEELEAKQ